MADREVPFADLLTHVVDNRGRTCPTSEAGVPLIATNCIRNDLLYPAFEKVRYVSQSTYKDWFRGHPEPGDIIFVCKGTPGRVCLTPDPVGFCIAQDMVAVRADSKKVYPRFLFAALRSDLIQRRIENMHVGTLIPHFKKGDFDKLLIPLPNYSSQVGIGDLYFTLSAKIDSNRRMNATLEEMARALFKNWFVDFDPVRAKMEGKQPAGMDAETAALFPGTLEESELGLVPCGWRVESIKDVVEAVFDGPHATPKESDTGPVYLGIKNLTGSLLNLNEIRHISEEDWPVWTKRVTPQAGDIVFSYEATLGFFAIIPSNLRCCLGRRLALVRPYTKGGNGHFWFMQFISDPFQKYLKKHSVSGATVDRIPLVDFPKYRVLSPPKPIVRVFDDMVSSFWQKIHSNLSQANSLALIRDTLLPKLLSGEISMVDAETEVANV
jgi:type I restriction enzyme S subunit